MPASGPWLGLFFSQCCFVAYPRPSLARRLRAPVVFQKSWRSMTLLPFLREKTVLNYCTLYRDRRNFVALLASEVGTKACPAIFTPCAEIQTKLNFPAWLNTAAGADAESVARCASFLEEQHPGETSKIERRKRPTPFGPSRTFSGPSHTFSGPCHTFSGPSQACVFTLARETPSSC